MDFLDVKMEARSVASSDPTNEEVDRWNEEKSALMESMLGQEHDMVMHAMIPYRLGGGLDLYYYPHGRPGTAIATKELCELPDQGPSNLPFNQYELVMFTKLPVDLDAASNEETVFGRIHTRINAILNCIAPYSAEAELNPGETCEFPADMEVLGGGCVIFDGLAPEGDDETSDFGLLVLIEIFRSELEFARANSGAELLELLKAKGHYPYSDLDRTPVA
jgi:hypothetical protein